MAEYIRVVDDFVGPAGPANGRLVPDVLSGGLRWVDPRLGDDFIGAALLDGAGNLTVGEKAGIEFSNPNYAYLTLAPAPPPGAPAGLFDVIVAIGYDPELPFTPTQVSTLLDWADDPVLAADVAGWGDPSLWDESLVFEFQERLSQIESDRLASYRAASWPVQARTNLVVRLDPADVGVAFYSTSTPYPESIFDAFLIVVATVIPDVGTPYVQVSIFVPGLEDGELPIFYDVPEMAASRQTLELTISSTGDLRVFYGGVERTRRFETIFTPEVYEATLAGIMDSVTAGYYTPPTLAVFTDEAGETAGTNGWAGPYPRGLPEGGPALSRFEFVLSTDAPEPFWTQFVGTYEAV